MTELTAKQSLLMVTTFTLSPLFAAFIVAFIFGFHADALLDTLTLAVKYAFLGLALYFLPATLLGIIFTRQIVLQDQSDLHKIVKMSIIGFVICAVWAMLFGYFYVGDIQTQLNMYITVVLALGLFGAISSTLVTLLALKFLLSIK